ncbi:holo-ACP synthase [Candidatus Margulisiibacteriota bacterium]
MGSAFDTFMTQIKTGIDLMHIPRFKRSVESGGREFLTRLFHEEELTNQDIEHLAGIYAAKEAVIKAFSLPTDAWKEIYIQNDEKGSPRLTQLLNDRKILTHDLSISHDGEYVIAQFTALIEK